MASPLPSTVMRPLTRRVCAKALALTSTSNNSENTDERILFMPVLQLGWVRLAATGAASPAELKGLCLVFWWPLFRRRDRRGQEGTDPSGTRAARKFSIHGQKNAGQKPAFLVRFQPRLRTLGRRWGRR